MTKVRVDFLTGVVTHYRVPFHERVRAILARSDIDYRLHHGPPAQVETIKRDLAVPPWAIRLNGVTIGKRGQFSLHWICQAVRSSDLVIMGQENRFLHNYALQLLPSGSRPRIAFFGHGRNFQARNPGGLFERWKRIWATRVDWWFGYTDATKANVESLGFPPDRITVFNNAVDTRELAQQCAAVTPERLEQRRRELGLHGSNVGIFVGGLYPDKRLDFLLEAADAIRREIADFELLIVGSGEAHEDLLMNAASRPYVKVLGPRFGKDKAELMRLADLFLMPGLVGLAVLDAAAAGLPTITTDFPWHSPEIAYLESGKNGLVVEAWKDSQAYADAIIGLLKNRGKLEILRAGARALSQDYTIEAMAERFAEGVIAALAASKRKFHRSNEKVSTSLQGSRS